VQFLETQCISSQFMCVTRLSRCPCSRLILATSLDATGPVGRVTSNLGDNGDQLYLVPSNFCSWLSFFFAGQCSKPDFLAEFNGRRKEE